jgi:hypothetical protein
MTSRACAERRLQDVAELHFGRPSDVDTCLALSDGGAGYDLVLGSDITYEGIGVDFTELVGVMARLLRRHTLPVGPMRQSSATREASEPEVTSDLWNRRGRARALIAHETRLLHSGKLAADGGDPAVAKLRHCASLAGLECSILHDDRGAFQLAHSSQRCVLQFQHREA